jgi:outer membrane murein-binding lipoprotein Lpp
MLALQTICLVAVFTGAVIIALCNLISTSHESDLAATDTTRWSRLRQRVLKHRIGISFFSAIVVAAGTFGNLLLGGKASRAASDAFTNKISDLSEQVLGLSDDNDSLRATLEPIAEMAKSAGISIRQMIDSIYADKVAYDEQSRLRQAKLGVNDFRRMIGEYDNHLREKSIDSISQDFASRGLLHSGMYLKALGDFAVDYRRRRDNSIDSALVLLERLGVNTDTLRFSRRLSVRIGDLLRRTAGSIGLDYRSLPSTFRYDTL